MKLLKFFIISFLFLSSNVFSQAVISKLKLCPQAEPFLTWNNCYSEYSYVNGSTYKGEWQGGKYHGQGMFKYKVGNGYIGSFKYGKYDGKGLSYYFNGEKYDGMFQDGIFNGQGKYTFADGTVYIGEFKDGQHADKNRYFGPKVLDLVKVESVLPLKNSVELPAIQIPQATQAQLPPSVVTQSLKEKRIALVIGNSSYSIRPLSNPKNDADDVSKALKISGFEVIDV